MCGEKGLDLGNDLGPWTVQLSFKPEHPDLDEVSTSRYADPEAEGVTPVLRSKFSSVSSDLASNRMHKMCTLFSDRGRWPGPESLGVLASLCFLSREDGR